MARPVRIALYGEFAGGNLGNDGSFEAVLAALRERVPDAEFSVFTRATDAVRERYGLPTRSITTPRASTSRFPRMHSIVIKGGGKLFDFPRMVAMLRTVDVVIVPGMGVLEELEVPFFGLPYELSCLAVAGRLARTATVLLSVGAEPIVHPISRRLMLFAARRMAYRSYRDSYSSESLRAMGLDVSNDMVSADVAYSLPDPVQAERSAGTVIGVGVMTYHGRTQDPDEQHTIYTHYVSTMAQFVRHLVRRGHRVRLVTGDRSDRQAIDDICAALTPVELAGVELSIAETLTELTTYLRSTDVVVASRFHNIVCATKAGVPTLSISYATKSDVLLEAYGLGPYRQHIDTFDADVLVSQFEELWIARGRLAAPMAATTAGFRSALTAQYDDLVDRVVPNGRPR